jgi:xanthine dehydrogenase molybdopterin-binding subunit B
MPSSQCVWYAIFKSKFSTSEICPQIQQKNLYKTGELTNGNVPVEASIGRCFEEVLKQSDYVAEYQRIEEFNKYA